MKRGTFTGNRSSAGTVSQFCDVIKFKDYKK